MISCRRSTALKGPAGIWFGVGVSVPAGTGVEVREGALVGVRVGRGVRVAVAVGLGVLVKVAVEVGIGVSVVVDRRSKVLAISVGRAGLAQPASMTSRIKQTAARVCRVAGSAVECRMVMMVLYIKNYFGKTAYSHYNDEQ